MARVWNRLSSLSVVFGFPLTLAGVALAQAPAPTPPVAPPPTPPAPDSPPPAPVPAPPGPVAPSPVQPAPTAPQPPAPVLSPPAPVVPEPAPAPPEPTPAPLAPPPVIAAPEVAPATPIESPREAVPEPATPELPWYETITVSAFADAYYSLNFNLPKGDQREPIRAFDRSEGFGLSWVGLDISKEAEPVGGTISLRFGPTAQRLASRAVGSPKDSDYAGLEFVKQGFVSWRPMSGPLRLDLGKFDSPYGVEVAEAQYDINYTRGALYWLGQPYFHTGLRLTADLARSFTLKLLAVNGWNNSIDNNLMKTFGLQGTYRLPGSADEDLLRISLGYLFGPEHDDTAVISCGPGSVPDVDEPDGCAASANATGGSLVVDRGTSNQAKAFRHFLDLAVVAQPSPDLVLTLNSSLGIDNQRVGNTSDFESAVWWGVAAAGRIGLGDMGLGLRGEYVNDHDGYTTGFGDLRDAEGNPPNIDVLTGTATFDYSPTDFLRFMFDVRVDWSNRKIFPKEVRELTGLAVSTTLGAIVMTN